MYLESPLQSWGLRSRWDVRDSGDEPSKSGVIGLLGCALGYGVGDPYLQELDKSLRMGVRVERAGRKITDYHTVTGIMRTADGGLKGSDQDPNTIVSPRTYLQDAAFLVALEGDTSVLHSCAEALQNPRWPVYLGRKACVPSRPVFQELTDAYANMHDALRRYPWLQRSPHDKPPERLRCVLEDDAGGHIRSDKIRVNRARMYQNRLVRIDWVPCPRVVPAWATDPQPLGAEES